MLKRILTFLLFCVLLFSFSGCGMSESEVLQGNEQINTSLSWIQEEGLEETSLFTFSLDGDVVWKRGAQIEFITLIEYLGEEPYVCKSGSLHYAALPIVYYNADGSYELSDESYSDFTVGSVWDDYTFSSIQSGEKSSHYYFVNVPEDAPLGKYHILLHFDHSYYQFFENAIEIVE